jgi:hypothetical protein
MTEVQEEPIVVAENEEVAEDGSGEGSEEDVDEDYIRYLF